MTDVPRSRRARAAAESALVRVAHHYGEQPPFVLIGGLVPELLCTRSPNIHAGTTDVDVQVDLEISTNAVNARRLERALANAEFQPDDKHIWRWKSPRDRALVKFELLADQDDQPNEQVLRFTDCDALGAVNLRGTGWAAKDTAPAHLSAKIGGVMHDVTILRTDLAGFLCAKLFAARGRRKEKDWYDIAFVLQHNDRGGPREAAAHIQQTFGAALAGAEMRTALMDVRANFATGSSQGARAYAEQMDLDHDEVNEAELRADAVLAVEILVDALLTK